MIDQNLLNSFKETPGAISVTEAVALYQLLKSRRHVKDGCFVDLGSNAGKSSMIASAALSANGSSGHFWLVDPVYDADIAEWQMWSYAAYKEEFMGGIRDRIASFSDIETCFYAGFSLDFLSTFKGKIDYCFIDSGDHTADLLNKEMDALIPLLTQNALLVFHDYGSQFTPVAYCYDALLERGFNAVEIDWESINEYTIENDLLNGNNSWHHPDSACPNYIGALTK